MFKKIRNIFPWFKPPKKLDLTKIGTKGLHFLTLDPIKIPPIKSKGINSYTLEKIEDRTIKDESLESLRDYSQLEIEDLTIRDESLKSWSPPPLRASLSNTKITKENLKKNISNTYGKIYDPYKVVWID